VNTGQPRADDLLQRHCDDDADDADDDGQLNRGLSRARCQVPTLILDMFLPNPTPHLDACVHAWLGMSALAGLH